MFYDILSIVTTTTRMYSYRILTLIECKIAIHKHKLIVAQTEAYLKKGA